MYSAFIKNNSRIESLEILNYLKSDLNFDENFLKSELILQKKNNKKENVLQLIFLRPENLEEFNDFVENQFKISVSELKSSLIGEPESGTSWNPVKSVGKRPSSVPASCPILAFHIAEKSVENQEKYLNFMKKKIRREHFTEINFR